MDIRSRLSKTVPAVVEFNATVSSDKSNDSVDLSEPVRAVHLTMLNEARSIVLEFKSAFTQISRGTSTANLLQTI